ncbi:unnamed protein product, partial [Rotaria sp. Silwood1]
MFYSSLLDTTSDASLDYSSSSI